MARQAKAWSVAFDSDAVIDFEDVKSRGDRKAVFNVVQKLKDVGPDLPSPHMKSLKGEADLFELRPRQGACEARPIYARVGQRFVVLAVAAKKKDFNARSRWRLTASADTDKSDNAAIITCVDGSFREDVRCAGCRRAAGRP